jgi:hypothetical protein
LSNVHYSTQGEKIEILFCLQDFSIDLRRFGNFAIVGEEGEQEEGVREGLGQLKIEEPMLNNYPQVS